MVQELFYTFIIKSLRKDIFSGSGINLDVYQNGVKVVLQNISSSIA